MIIPSQRISPDALENLIEEYITREGTDYGLVELDLSSKVEQVKQQLKLGEVVIVFDESMETVNLVTARDYQQMIGNRD